MSKIDLSKYRKNAGIVLINDEGLVWAGERDDVKGAWQLPQGGIDEGEEPIDAAWRELFEETGVSKDEAELITEHADWVTYEWPGENKFPNDPAIGQAQRWFIFRFTGDKIDLNKATDKEFQDWQWVTAEWLYDQVIEFRKPVYKQVFSAFANHLG